MSHVSNLLRTRGRSRALRQTDTTALSFVVASVLSRLRHQPMEELTGENISRFRETSSSIPENHLVLIFLCQFTLAWNPFTLLPSYFGPHYFRHLHQSVSQSAFIGIGTHYSPTLLPTEFAGSKLSTWTACVRKYLFQTLDYTDNSLRLVWSESRRELSKDSSVFSPSCREHVFSAAV